MPLISMVGKEVPEKGTVVAKKPAPVEGGGFGETDYMKSPSGRCVLIGENGWGILSGLSIGKWD